MKRLPLVAIGLLIFSIGFGVGQITTQNAEAASCTVDQTILERLYSGIFHRSLDDGASGYIGHDVGFVIDQLMISEEHSFYGSIFSTVKKIENHRREGVGDLNSYTDELSVALGNLSSWAAGKTVNPPAIAVAANPVQSKSDSSQGPSYSASIIATSIAPFYDVFIAGAQVRSPEAARIGLIEVKGDCFEGERFRVREVSFRITGEAADLIASPFIGSSSAFPNTATFGSPGGRWSFEYDETEAGILSCLKSYPGIPSSFGANGKIGSESFYTSNAFPITYIDGNYTIGFDGVGLVLEKEHEDGSWQEVPVALVPW